MENYIITDNSEWEKQFIYQDLLQIDDKSYNKIIYTNENLNYYNTEGWKKLENIEDIINNNIFIFSSNKHRNNYINDSDLNDYIKKNKKELEIKTIKLGFSLYARPAPLSRKDIEQYYNILNIVKLLKPKIIIHLSDEWGNKEYFQNLYQYTNLLLRQYKHNYYDRNNIEYIPLGYMNEMLEKDYLNIKLKLSEERKYIWSFIGDIKKKSNKGKIIDDIFFGTCEKYPGLKEREYMVNKMKFFKSNYYGKATKTEMRNIYRESIFVPNCRGNLSLNCFRLYEASLCGAIPIIVGDEKEIEETFCREENPPWLTFDSWDNAVTHCKYLLKDMDKLNRISRNNISWWKYRVLKIRDLIKNNLH